MNKWKKALSSKENRKKIITKVCLNIIKHLSKYRRKQLMK